MSLSSVVAPTVHRFTREEYYRMGEAGLFFDERVELLKGEIITMAPQNPPHASVVTRMTATFIRLLGNQVVIRAQLPIVLDDLSEPEPDIVLCRPDPEDYEREHPKADHILLVIEVAEASLAYDRSRKVSAYAASGISEYWIVNLVDRQVEVFRDPEPARQQYTQTRMVLAGDTVTVPNGPSLAVADILPRQ